MPTQAKNVIQLSELCCRGEFDRVGQALVAQQPIRAAALAVTILAHIQHDMHDEEAAAHFVRYLVECSIRTPNKTAVEVNPVHDCMTVPEIILEVLHRTEAHPEWSIHQTSERLVNLQAWINPLSRTEAVVLVNNWTSRLLGEKPDKRTELLAAERWPTTFKTPLPAPYPGPKR